MQQFNKILQILSIILPIVIIFIIFDYYFVFYSLNEIARNLDIYEKFHGAIRAIANNLFMPIFWTCISLTIVWIFITNIFIINNKLSSKIINFILGLLLIIVSTIGLGLISELSVYNDGFALGGGVNIFIKLFFGYIPTYFIFLWLKCKFSIKK